MEAHFKTSNGMEQWFPNLGSLDVLGLQLPEILPAQLMVKAPGSCSPRTPGDLRMETTGIEDNRLIKDIHSSL